MDKKLFNYHHTITHSPSDFINLVFEIDEDDRVSEVHFHYYRDQKPFRLWTYIPKEGAFFDYEGSVENFKEIFTHSSSLPQNNLYDYHIEWWKDANSWDGDDISLATFLVRLSQMMDTDRPLWVLSIFTKYLYDQTEPQVELLRENEVNQEYIIPTSISQIDQWTWDISIPQIKDDKLQEIIDELLYEESDFYYQYQLIETDEKTTIEVKIES